MGIGIWAQSDLEGSVLLPQKSYPNAWMCGYWNCIKTHSKCVKNKNVHKDSYIHLKACILSDLYQQSQSSKIFKKSSPFHGVCWVVSWSATETCFVMDCLAGCCRSYPIFKMSVSTYLRRSSIAKSPSKWSCFHCRLAAYTASLPWIQKPCK